MRPALFPFPSSMSDSPSRSWVNLLSNGIIFNIENEQFVGMGWAGKYRWTEQLTTPGLEADGLTSTWPQFFNNYDGPRSLFLVPGIH